jgi:hypothetical protein
MTLSGCDLLCLLYFSDIVSDIVFKKRGLQADTISLVEKWFLLR